MKKNISEISKSVVERIRGLVMSQGYVLLHCKEHEQSEQAGDKLLGYYDNNGVYVIPDKLLALSADIVSASKKSVIDIEYTLWSDKLIICEQDGAKIRYRRQKRVGKTKMRYLTFRRDALFNDDEQSRFIPYRI